MKRIKLIKWTMFILLLGIMVTGYGGMCQKDSNSGSSSSNAVIIPDTTKVIAASEPVTFTDNSTLTLGNTSPQTTSLSVGDIIVSDVTEQAPDGYLRKVTGITTTDNQTNVQTSQATLEEAIQSCNVSVSKALLPSDIKKSVALRKGVTIDGYSVALTKVIYDIDSDYSTTNDQIRIDGSFSINPSFEFGVVIDGGTLKEVKFINTTTQTAHLTLTACASYDIQEEMEIAQYSFTPIVIWIGIVPVVITPKIIVYVGIDGSVSAEITTGITEQASFSVGVSYANSTWSHIGTANVSFDPPNLPSLSVTGSIKGYVGPRLNFLLYGVAGPNVGVQGYLKLTADISQTPAWTLCGGLEIGAGVRVEVLSKKIAEYYYPNIITPYEIVLAQAQSETICTPNKPTGTTVGTIGTSYNYSTGGASSSFSHSVEYQFDWKGDGTDLSDWGSASQSKTWLTSDTYSVRSRARCFTHTTVISGWSSGLSVSIFPPTETVSTPRQPSGTTSGNTGTSYNYSNGVSSSNLAHSLEYRFDWGDGTYSTWSSSTTASHSWSSSGAYTVKGEARCTTHTTVISGWSSGLSVNMTTISETVSIPNKPAGIIVGTIGTSYSYSTGGASSSFGHSIQYRFDWGDGTYSTWSSSITASHSWSSVGAYIVKAQARCASDTSITSNWSSGLTVNAATTTGSIAITVRGISTNPGPWAGTTVKVIRYTTSWSVIDTVYADSNWVATFSNIPTGQYWFESYQLGAFGVYEFWSAGLYTVNVNTSSYYTLNRDMPYVSSLTAVNNATGADVTGTTVPLGTTLRYTLSVVNPNGAAYSCKGKMYVNTSRTYNYSSPNYTTGSANISAGYQFTYTSWTYTPSSTGTYYHAAAVEALTGGGSYTCTDSTAFSTASYGWVTVANTTPTERLSNGGFESTSSNWTWSGSASPIALPYAGTYSAIPNSSSINGSGYFYQSVSIPSGATSANLSFYMKVTSDETSTTTTGQSTSFDNLYVEVLNSSGSVVGTLATYSDKNRSGTTSQTGTWNQKTGFSLISYKGQTIRLRFRATTDGSLQTIFLIDNVSLLANGG